MACTSQTAFDYVWSARIHLVGELKNLPVILENLYQQKVFNDEEVCEIETERNDYDKTRAILDRVIKKGEAACEVLLRIIDMTRMRTLERIFSFSEKTTGSSSEPKQFDLHHWISCFPFKEDTQIYGGCSQGPRPCHIYQEKLMEKAQKKVDEFWMRNQKLLSVNRKSDLSYSPLVLDTQGSGSASKIKKFKIKKSKMSRPKKLRTYIPEDKSKVSPSDLLKTNKNIVLVGKPGIGKTALCHEILKLWVERKSEKLDYMFYFDMRETSHITGVMSLEELLFSVYCEPDDGKDKVLQDIKRYSDNVTVIFDGVTDLTCSVVKRIVDRDLLPNAKVIIACRPDDEEDFFSGDFLTVEVKGFSEQAIKSYLLPILGEEHKKILCDLELLTLCHVPMYALMVAACLLCKTLEVLPRSKTEIYIIIVRFCLQVSSNKTNKHLDSFIQEKKKEILSLAEIAFHATERKSVSLTDLHCEDRCVLSFLKPLVVKLAPTKTKTTHAFLHYTVQEFFAAVWLLKNPNEIKDVFQQCLKEEKQHMKHLIPFMCRLLTEKSPSLMEHLIPAQELKNTSNWFFKELIDSGLDDDILSLCECIYESQCPEAGISLLKRLNYHLDLSGESLDSYLCCAVANVVALSRERKVSLDLEGVSVSEQGVRSLLGCLDNVQWSDPLPQQLWRIILLSEEQRESVTLLSRDGHQLHLPVQGERQLFERAVSVIQKNPMKVNVCLHWDSGATAVSQSLSMSLLDALHYIKSLSFSINNKGPGQQDKEQSHEMWEEKKMKLLLDLCLKAAIHRELDFHVVKKLATLFSVDNVHHLLLDFHQHVKSTECFSVIPKLKALYESTPSVWTIDLSKRKTSILLEVLKLQTEKKHVKLCGCPGEEDEVKIFLQCLPFISQLSCSFLYGSGDKVKFCGSLFCAAASEEKHLELLLSVCRYETFPFKDWERFGDFEYSQCGFLLDLYSYIKDSTTNKGLSVLPSVQSVFQSTPSVWFIDLSKRKTSILLEVLKLQTEKKHVKLFGCSVEEDEVKIFLQCLPFISQLSFWSGDEVKFCGSLFCAAATEEKHLELLLSVCRYQTFPFEDREGFDDFEYSQCGFLLDLYSYIKESTTYQGLSVLPSVQSVFQSTPSVWSINLSERKTSILLELLKLQTEKKHVKLKGYPDDESKVKMFLQCLPLISQLSCGPELFQRVCTSISLRSKQEAEQAALLLQLLGFNRQLKGKLLSQTCQSVGQVLGLCGPSVDLILTPQQISVGDALLVFRQTTKLRSLRLSTDMALILSLWVKRGRVVPLSVTDELSLVSETFQPSESVWLKVVSSLAYLLRHWTVRRLDLTESRIPAQALTPLLLHNGPLTIKLNEKISEPLLDFLSEIQDEDLTRSFLSKVDGDLTPFSLNWEFLHLLLQSSSQTLTVNMRKNSFLQRSVTCLLPFLDRVVFERPSPSFVLTVMREIYKTQASSSIPGLLRSCDDVINLTCKQMDSEDCAALLYTLKHSDGVKLNLLWTLIPPGEINLILSMLDKVSHLSVDRELLLKMLHSCAASDAVDERAASLLRALQHRLDLSCSSHVEMSEEGQRETFCLDVADCWAISTVLGYNIQDTELNLQDCVVESSGLNLLPSVLNRVKLRASKVVVLQLMSILVDEFYPRSWAESLHRALGGDLDLSHTELDQKACEGLALMLDFVEEVTELDLSHCQLTDQLLCTLIKSLHKVQVIDLSHNRITGASTSMLLELISKDSCTKTVRLFGNTMVDQTPLKKNKQFEIW
ncbi:uncharacterized protein LOC117808220 isoform X8 [Xyrichtys novacula]|uniref:Uncharacterized protein LOC117808220 isoform X8 n=1 Tax=Xyrichtys novacula TaxID=13765 RepID=A0AAV1H9F1_XYRNO|nr:uncharacterized protein LOC117808220 isoform X8 [Xyrichtys novacula]